MGQCIPGAQVECACQAGKGAQTCKDDGTGYDVCMCPAGSSGTTSGGSTTTGGTSTGTGGSSDAAMPPANPCPAGCPKYQVCSGGTDGHAYGECWGCVPIADNLGWCGPNYPMLQANCQDNLPDGCIRVDMRICCK